GGAGCQARPVDPDGPAAEFTDHLSLIRKTQAGDNDRVPGAAVIVDLAGHDADPHVLADHVPADFGTELLEQAADLGIGLRLDVPDSLHKLGVCPRPPA